MRFAKQISQPAKLRHVNHLTMLLMCFSCIASVANGQHRGEEFDNRDEPTRTIETGMLFINDEFIPGPYDVEVTQTAVTVNGVMAFELEQETADQRVEGQRPNARRQPGFRGQQGQRGGGESGPRGRRGGPGGGGGGRGERPGGRLVSTLVTDGIVVVRTGAETRYLDGKDLYVFCKAMIADSPNVDLMREFAALAKSEQHESDWKKWLLSFEPNADLREKMQYEVERSDTMIATADAKTLAISRLEQFTYPLTIVGMLLSVLALGHLLKWATKIVMAESANGESGEVIRCAEFALLLMLAMSALDLVWTILAGQAGIMREVNPLAAKLLQTPMQLVLFKVAATGLGFAILFVWRRRTQIQQATWWMCLVCVLLTFRWVVFDSVVN